MRISGAYLRHNFSQNLVNDAWNNGRKQTPAVRRKRKSRDDDWVVTQGRCSRLDVKDRSSGWGASWLKNYSDKMPWTGPSD